MPIYHPLLKLSTRQLLERVFGIPMVKPCVKLHEAARQGSEDVVRQAIDSGSELDGIDEEGRSALQVAASGGCSEIFAMLIEAGATPDGPLIPPVSVADFYFISFRFLEHSFSTLILVWLASKLHIPAPSFIVRNIPIWLSAHLIAMPTLYCLSTVSVFRSYPNVFSNARSTIEALSTFKGDTEYMFLLLLDAQTDLESLGVEEKELLWSHAVERGYTGVCQRLLRSGFPVDWLYVHDEWPDIITALLHACGAAHRELVVLLLSNNADPTFLDNHGRSCLTMAVVRPYTEHAGSVEESDAILEDLLQTDALQHIDTVQTELDSELPGVTFSSRNGWPLAGACQELRASAVRILLEASADPNLKTKSGWTALHAACRWHVPETIEVVRLLVRYGADVNAVSDPGWTPLGCAASIGQFVELVELLVESGAQLESTAGDSSSLQVAARHDVSGGEVVRYLAGKGADVNRVGGKYGSVLLATLERPGSFVRDSDGSVSWQHDPSPQIVEFLSEFLEHGLDLNLVPEGRESPLYVAAQKNLSLVVSFLLEHGGKLPSLKGTTYPRSSPDQLKTSGLPGPVPQTSILSHLQPYHHSVFSVLLDHGVPPDADVIEFDGNLGITVLGAACSSVGEDYLRTANLLLEHGADPNFRDTRGHLPIQRAAYAVSVGHLQKLIQYGASVQTDDHDKYGNLLHSLCRGCASKSTTERDFKAFLSCFRFLGQVLPRGSVWRQDGAGRNCLHYLAEMSEEIQVIVKLDGTFSKSLSPVVPILEELLNIHGHPHPLERVPDPTLEVFRVADSDSRLAFHIASQRGDVHFMDTLLQHIKSLEVRDEWSMVSQADIVAALMTQPDIRGWNALHYAASEGRPLACEYILEATKTGAATTVTASGELPQDLANENHHYGVSEYITNFLKGIAGDMDATEKAESILASVVRTTVLLEFSEEQILEAIREERRRHLLRM